MPYRVEVTYTVKKADIYRCMRHGRNQRKFLLEWPLRQCFSFITNCCDNQNTKCLNQVLILSFYDKDSFVLQKRKHNKALAGPIFSITQPSRKEKKTSKGKETNRTKDFRERDYSHVKKDFGNSATARALKKHKKWSFMEWDDDNDNDLLDFNFFLPRCASQSSQNDNRLSFSFPFSPLFNLSIEHCHRGKGHS